MGRQGNPKRRATRVSTIVKAARLSRADTLRSSTCRRQSDSPAAVQSVDRALQVLDILAELGNAGVTEIASELGVHKSTVSRLVAVLESRGFVEQLSDRGKYRLGFTIVRLAGSTSAQLDLAKESQPICDRLAAQTGETTNVAVLDAGTQFDVGISDDAGERRADDPLAQVPDGTVALGLEVLAEYHRADQGLSVLVTDDIELFLRAVPVSGEKRKLEQEGPGRGVGRS